MSPRGCRAASAAIARWARVAFAGRPSTATGPRSLTSRPRTARASRALGRAGVWSCSGASAPSTGVTRGPS
eukprot:5022994-Lingulodinium_polyedra.AAC.1